MAKEVGMSTANLDVGRVQTAPEFHITENDRAFGDLRVSKGGAYWRPKNDQKYCFLTWDQVDKLFQERGEKKTVGQYTIAAPAGGPDEAEAEVRSDALRQS